LVAWCVVALGQVAIFVQVPAHVVVFGVDVTRETKLNELHQTLWIAMGIALVLWSLWVSRWGTLLVVLSSAIYLVNWLPLHSIVTNGLGATARMTWIVGSTPGIRLTYLLWNVLLPIAFAVAVVLSLWEMKRPRAPARD